MLTANPNANANAATNNTGITSQQQIPVASSNHGELEAQPNFGELETQPWHGELETQPNDGELERTAMKRVPKECRGKSCINFDLQRCPNASA
jgi:hypothetical protein